jgi:hypothetical protein
MPSKIATSFWLALLAASTITEAQHWKGYQQCCVCDGGGGRMVKIDATSNCPKACSDKQMWFANRLESCPAAIPLENRRPGTSDNSFAYPVGGADFSGLCNTNLKIDPVPVKPTVGKPFTLTVYIVGQGGLGGGSCNIHSGGEIEWGDGTHTELDVAPASQGDPCSGPQFTRLTKNRYTLTHEYTEVRTGKISAGMQGDFRMDKGGQNAGSYRCRAQRTESFNVGSGAVKP